MINFTDKTRSNTCRNENIRVKEGYFCQFVTASKDRGIGFFFLLTRAGS